jgi:CelD/BcsL family acetyltransferase involved in cellulose biosynthesis
MVEVIQLNDPAWAAFVDAHPGATCFHLPQWSQLLADCYGYPGFVVVERERSGAILAGMPVLEVRQLTLRRRWACLPFSDECGPLVGSGGSKQNLLTGADELRRRANVDHLEVRDAISDIGWPSHPVGVIHSHPLYRDLDAVMAGFSSSGRRNVRKAQRTGVTIRHAQRQDDIGQFYALHLRTRQRQGVPVQPRRYFRLLSELIIVNGHGTLLLAEYGGKAVAGAVFLLGGRTVTYKYGASDPAHWGLYPNNLLLWHAMGWAAERGCTRFDWGRSGVEDGGLRRFKSSLGGQERPLRYTRIPDGKPEVGGWAPRLLRPVLTRSPAAVCRAAGELLYRYAG